MYTVVAELDVGKYMVLALDRAIEDVDYTKYKIDGEEYDIVPVYDLPNNIAVKSRKSFIGSKVECI